ncbi:glutarate-semialdehyde dehydrogenase [Anthonomus grandis grandis]|uniref:glutarate-semialdehyde dehydrogenase n=1 Tax=Anthonomus grandis grandis TaxID=2921223 RepID=UPI00216617B8|nr:glutarate-semialdehyde dehydrogenase [Anthonomus grandis grandis]
MFATFRNLAPALRLNGVNVLRHIHQKPALYDANMLQQQAFINGEWISAKSGKTFEVLNPANGEVVGVVPDMDLEDTEAAIKAACDAFHVWKDTTAKERSQILREWYNLLVKNQKEMAEILTLESGKPLAEANGEVVYGNSFVEWFSELSRQIRGDIVQSSVPSKKILVQHQPIGVVGLITPWNFPHAMITRKAAPALGAGCTVIIKPAEDTPLTAIQIVKYAQEAGFPPGVVNLVTSSRANTGPIGKLLCEHHLVAGISFTGSTAVGKILYKQCAQGVKRLALELGGNAPFIVFNSANLDKAVDGSITSKFRNCGQTCVSANRFFIQEKVYDEYVNKLVHRVKSLKIGDGSQEGVQLGPLVNEPQLHKVAEFVNDAVSKGAKILTGGKPATHLGKLFYEPTILTDIKEDMLVYNQEVFGPVISLIKFKTEKEALDIANSTDVGLAGYFYSEDVSQIFRVSNNLEVGMIGVNEGIISCAEAPFGGIKQSGLGREGSHLGMEDFTYVKYTCIGNLS